MTSSAELTFCDCGLEIDSAALGTSSFCAKLHCLYANFLPLVKIRYGWLQGDATAESLANQQPTDL